VVLAFHNDDLPILGTLLKLSDEAHIPMGIEYVDHEQLTRIVPIDTSSASVDKILQALFQNQPGYTWSARDGVVIISNTAIQKSSSNVLRLLIPTFILKRDATLQEASNLLWMNLQLLLKPSTGGFAGEFSSGNLKRTISKVELRSKSVSSILDYLVSCDGNSVWIIQVPPQKLDTAMMDGNKPWIIVNRPRTRSQSGATLNDLLQHFPIEKRSAVE
jgi:hypothetical protein